MRFIADTVRTCTALLGVGLLAACAGTSLPPIVVRDSADRGNDIEVHEVRRLLDCGRTDGPAAIEWIADETALRSWQAARGVELIGSSAAELPAGPYAVVDHGARTTGGYGFAVSRQARVVIGRTLRLTASFLAPKPGAEPASAPISPCALMQLPAGRYERVELVDPSGRRQAIVEVPASVRGPDSDEHHETKD